MHSMSMELSMLVLAFLTISVTLASSQLTAPNTYVHPHEVVQQLQQVEKASSHLASLDYRDLKEFLEAIAPENFLQHLTKSANISEICYNQTLYTLESIIVGGKNNTWALEMIDAWGKPNAGILRGAIDWLGNYDECQIVQSPVKDTNDTPVPHSEFGGKYCGLGSPLGTATVTLIQTPKINVGSCFPSGCSEEDIKITLSGLLDHIQPNLSQSVEVTCQEEDMAFSDTAIAAIVLYCIMGSLCLAGTAYDIITIMSKPSEEEQHAQSNGQVVNEFRTDNSDTEILISPNDMVKKNPPKPGALGDFLMCFSLYTNGYKLLSTKQAPGSLNCLNGIRFISMTWVILGHTIVFSFSAIGDLIVVTGWMKRFSFQAIINATVSVDSFFVLSALLTSYLFLKDLEKKNTTPTKFFITVPIMYLHRYIRLTPPYAFMILFYAGLMLYTYSGPLKPAHTTIGDKNCATNWWTALLYMNNVVEPTKMCAGWGWYLSNDFQFYLVTPFVVYILFKIPIVGMILSAVMVVISAVTATIISVNDDLGLGIGGARDPVHHPDPSAQKNYMSDYYFTPWARYQSFGVGVIFGYILWKCKGKLPVSKYVNLALWGASATLLVLVLYAPFDVESGGHIASVAEASIYNGWARIAWSIGLGYVMLACCLGRGGWVNEFLSWPGFVPLSRMTYCAYLVHPVIMTIVSSSHKNKSLWSDITYIYMFAGYLTLSYAVAFLFSIVFEAPFMHIDKKYITGRLSKSVK